MVININDCYTFEVGVKECAFLDRIGAEHLSKGHRAIHALEVSGFMSYSPKNRKFYYGVTDTLGFMLKANLYGTVKRISFTDLLNRKYV